MKKSSTCLLKAKEKRETSVEDIMAGNLPAPRKGNDLWMHNGSPK